MQQCRQRRWRHQLLRQTQESPLANLAITEIKSDTASLHVQDLYCLSDSAVAVTNGHSKFATKIKISECFMNL